MTVSFLQSLCVCIASCVAVAAAVTDLASSTIPNRLTLPVLLLAPLVHGFAAGPGALAASLLAALLCGLVPWLVFLRGGIGGGDVKLFAALGSLLGCDTGLRVELGSLTCAALYAGFALAFRGQLLRTLGRSLRLLSTLPPSAASDSSDSSLRLGPAIALATLFTLWLGELVP